MKHSNLTLALSLVLVFLSGAVVGALGFRWYRGPAPKSPDEYRKEYVAEMRQRLKLNDEQSKKLESVLDETRRKFHDLREKGRPEMKAIQDGQVAEIDAMLSPVQQAEYARMRKEREDKRKAEEQKRKNDK